MSENIIARGERNGKVVPTKKIAKITAIVAAIFVVFGIITSVIDAAKMIDNHSHSKYCYKYSYRDDFYDDLYDGNLRSYKMNCSYTKGALGLGIEYFFEGPVMFPLIIFIGGMSYVGIMRKRSRSYVLTVDEQNINVTYSDGKVQEIPLCSVFSVDKVGAMDLNIVTSEDSYTLRDMDGRDAVYSAIVGLMPTITIKGPANNEQVLAKGYPPAVKPLLLILLVLSVLMALIALVETEEFAVLLVMAIPVAIILVLYLAAKTPYLVVTDKRVFYVSDFGRKLSIPMNKITVTVTHHWFRQLHIAAPTGRIHLFWVRNTAELYDMITALINEKQ